MMDGYGSMMAWGWMWLFWALILIGLVLLVLLTIYLFRRNPTRPHDGYQDEMPRHGPTARQILDQRYAKGEIDTEEYQERLRHLEADR